jgi:hypothetical protein
VPSGGTPTTDGRSGAALSGGAGTAPAQQ